MKTEEQLKNETKNETILKESPKYRLYYYAAVGKYKSIRRAIKRGNVTTEGIIIPKRPFNNKANTSERKGIHSRTLNEQKKSIYKELCKYGKRFEFFN